jgi:hypothetical protein
MYPAEAYLIGKGAVEVSGCNQRDILTRFRCANIATEKIAK